jgi:hypothetical protein
MIAVRTGSLVEARDIAQTAASEADSADAQVPFLADSINACFYLGGATSALAAAHQIDARLVERARRGRAPAAVADDRALVPSRF